MAEDGEVLRQIWESYLPVAFHLSPDDRHSIKTPEPYYSMVPRLSYFSLVIDKVVVYFSQFIDSANKSAANLWLEHLDIPLRFNYPIGLLYDLYAPDIDLPWNITVNFDRFPEEVLVRCNSRATMESAFLSNLKEADALKRRQPLVSKMPKKDHNQLWAAVVNHKFDQFWSINRRLMAPNDEQNVFRNIPFRFYLRSKSDLPLLVQKLVKPILETGEPATYRHLIDQTLGKEYVDKQRLVLHGIHPELDTPLQWMSEHLSYSDNFLHIVVRD